MRSLKNKLFFILPTISLPIAISVSCQNKDDRVLTTNGLFDSLKEGRDYKQNLDLSTRTSLDNVGEENIEKFIKWNKDVLSTFDKRKYKIIQKFYSQGEILLELNWKESWFSDQYGIHSAGDRSEYKRLFRLKNFLQEEPKNNDKNILYTNKNNFEEYGVNYQTASNKIVNLNFVNFDKKNNTEKIISGTGFVIDCSIPKEGIYPRKWYIATNLHIAMHNNHENNPNNLLSDEISNEFIISKIKNMDGKNEKQTITKNDYVTYKLNKLPKTIYTGIDYMKTKPFELNPKIDNKVEEVVDFAVLEIEFNSEEEAKKMFPYYENFLHEVILKNNDAIPYETLEFIKDVYDTKTMDEQFFGSLGFNIDKSKFKGSNTIEKIKNSIKLNFSEENESFSFGQYLESDLPFSKKESLYTEALFARPNEYINIENKKFKTQGIIASLRNSNLGEGTSGAPIFFNRNQPLSRIFDLSDGIIGINYSSNKNSNSNTFFYLNNWHKTWNKILNDSSIKNESRYDLVGEEKFVFDSINKKVSSLNESKRKIILNNYDYFLEKNPKLYINQKTSYLDSLLKHLKEGETTIRLKSAQDWAKKIIDDIDNLAYDKSK